MYKLSVVDKEVTLSHVLCQLILLALFSLLQWRTLQTINNSWIRRPKRNLHCHL